MFNRFVTRAVGTGMLALAGLTTACGYRTPSAPSPVPQPNLSVLAIAPNTGSTVSPVVVTIRGTGFLAGATVTLDAAATAVTVIDDTTITAVAPAHAAGTVDVVVTNPSGQTSRLPGAFTYIGNQAYTISSSTSTVVVGRQLSVSWNVPSGGDFDWIGFFKVTDSSEAYESRWWQYTGGAKSGTLILDAPTTPGLYEFRYLLNDGFVDAARSATVTVTAG